MNRMYKLARRHLGRVLAAGRYGRIRFRSMKRRSRKRCSPKMSAPEPPRPIEIGRANEHDVRIRWKDGAEAVYPARLLRLECPCANCVDELTGRKLIQEGVIAEDVHPGRHRPRRTLRHPDLLVRRPPHGHLHLGTSLRLDAKVVKISRRLRLAASGHGRSGGGASRGRRARSHPCSRATLSGCDC